MRVQRYVPGNIWIASEILNESKSHHYKSHVSLWEIMSGLIEK